MRSPSERDVTNMTAEDMGRRKFEDHYTEGKQVSPSFQTLIASGSVERYLLF